MILQSDLPDVAITYYDIKPIHTLGAGYVLNLVDDLVPPCPNCHAMVHKGDAMLSIDELKGLMKK